MDMLLFPATFVRRELLRTIRQTRVLLWRTVIVVVVGAAVGTVYGLAYYQVISKDKVSVAALTAFGLIGWTLCFTFLPLLLQSLASIVTEDRESKRLDFLLMTDLRSREILLGKAMGRVATFAAYLFAPLPFCVMVPPFFGLAPAFLLLPLAYFALICLSCIGLSLVASVFSASSKKAGANATYLAGFYVLVTMALMQLQLYPPIWSFSFGSGVTVQDVVEAVSAGNPFPFIQTLPVMMLATGGNPMSLLLGNLRSFAAVHVALFAWRGVLAACWEASGRQVRLWPGPGGGRQCEGGLR